jgi:hypothetical protein
MPLTWWDVTPTDTWNGQDRRGLLMACIVLRFDDHLQDRRKSATEELRDFILHRFWRYIVLVDHRSCFPLSNSRMNHPSRANTKSKIHHSYLIGSTRFILSQAHRCTWFGISTRYTLSQAHRVVLGTGTLRYRYHIPATAVAPKPTTLCF